MKNNKEIFIITHLPKTGGTTLRENIRSNFKENEILELCFDNYVEKITKKEIINKIKSLSMKERDKIKVVIGHFATYGIHKYFNKKPKYIIFFRRTPERIISYYNYFLGRHLSNPSDFYFKKLMTKNNRIIKFKNWLYLNKIFQNINVKLILSGEYCPEKYSKKVSVKNLEDAKKVLDKYYFVGLIENEEDRKIFYKILSIKKKVKNKNISKKYFSTKNKKLRKKIIKFNKYDSLLNKHANKLNKKFKKNLNKI